MRECRFIQASLVSIGLSVAVLAAFSLPDFVVASPLMSTRSLMDNAPGLVETVQGRRGGHFRGRAVARGPRGGVAVRGRYGAAVRGPRGNVAVSRRGVVNRRVVNRTVVRRPVVVAPGWRRPAGYWWRPGGAIAAGAALGFVTAAAATAYVGQPPAPGYCWYYTNPQRTQGFWDICPR